MDENNKFPSEFCRTCLCTEKPLFVMEGIHVETLTECCASDQIYNLEKTVPNMICPNCQRIISEFKSFKTRYLEVDAILGNVAQVKCEINVLETDSDTFKMEMCDEPNQDFDDQKDFERLAESQTTQFTKKKLKIRQKRICNEKITQNHSKDIQEVIEEPTDDHECPKCSVSFKNAFELKRHDKETHQNPSKTPMECDTCGKIFSGHRALLRHWQTAHKHQPPPFRCDKCDKPFCRVQVLTNHIKSYHAADDLAKSTTCPICTKQFTDKRYVRRHIRNTHMNSNPIACPQCHKISKNEKLLKIHMQIHNNNTTPSLCVFCGLKFLRIAQHMARCRKQMHRATFRCRFCKREFATMTDLRTHHTDVHAQDVLKQELRYKCDRCEKKFANSSNLNTHVAYMHNEAKPFTCSICAKGFKQGGHLKRHMLYHLDERPFACQFCDKRFRERSKVKQHARIHTGEKPFKCRLCPLSFLRSDKLKVHVGEHGVEKK